MMTAVGSAVSPQARRQAWIKRLSSRRHSRVQRVMRWTPEMRQVAMRESCSYKRNRSSHEAVTAEAQRDV